MQKQAAILEHAATLLKPGGRLVYATCSILPEENQATVSNFLIKKKGFTLNNCGQVFAQHAIPLDTGDYLQLAPHTHATDGFFAAIIEKVK